VAKLTPEELPGGERAAVMLVDDDPLILDSLSVVLEADYAVHTAANRIQANQLLQGLKPVPALALVDLGLPPQPHAPDEGFALITDLLGFNRGMKILVLSGQSKRINVQHALTLGAVDFLPKPCEPGLLKARLAHQLMIIEAERPSAADEGTPVLLGESPALKTLTDVIAQFANTPFPVLIEGESGTGKELVAKCLHDSSTHADLPLITVNCAAFSSELLEAQLFGHVRGAFTGANADRPGFFEEAGLGSLFLDEIGEFPLELQPKLLRVLENGEYYRVGETQARTAQARLMAATNRDLREEIHAGNFRQDLYHRLSVLTIKVPALNVRGGDCLLLLQHFQNLYASTVAPFTLEPDAASYFAGYSFPGNVRELRNIVIRLGAKYPGQRVTITQLTAELETETPFGSDTEISSADERAVRELGAGGFRLDETLAGWERRYIEAGLSISNGNLSKAARLLGVNRTTLYSRIERLGIEVGTDD
jgi:DNA-binding NtrC family response regulator